MRYCIKNMWSRYVISLLMAIMPVLAMAQGNSTTVLPENGSVVELPSEQTVPVRIDEYTIKFLEEQDSLRSELQQKKDSIEILKKRISDLERTNAKLKTKINLSDSLSSELQKKQVNLSMLQNDTSSLRQKNNKLESQIEETDKSLERIASNFLFIYYEAFSIEYIAIPAYKSISSNNLKNEGRMKYTLLENYKKDVHELYELYKIIETDLVDEYTFSGKDHISEIEGSEAYKRYSNSGYSKWGKTYLGKNMLDAISILRNFTPENRKTLKALITELEKCIATEEEL